MPELLHSFTLPVTPAAPSSVTSSTVAAALKILQPHLPVSLPLYHRLRFGRFFESSNILSNLALEATGQAAASSTADGGEWLIAFVDRSARPETEVWMFASWEVQNPASEQPKTGMESRNPQQDELIRRLVRTMATIDIPKNIHQDVVDAKSKVNEASDTRDGRGFARADYSDHIQDTNIVLAGAVHQTTEAILQRNGLVATRFSAGKVPNHTFIFDVDRLPDAPALPQGLTWGNLSLHDLDLVRERTQIPRQKGTMAVLPSLGIFSDATKQLISWAFVGVDGSLTTLHVEPEWRGRGLAKAITVKLITERMDFMWETGGRRQSHGFVQMGNEASYKVCASLGGRSTWLSSWVRVDIGALDG